MSTQVTESRVLDSSGTLCPMPVIQAKQAMDKLSRGQVLKVIATDPGSKADIPSWARAAGHHLLKAEQQDKKFLFWVQKGQEGAQ